MNNIKTQCHYWKESERKCIVLDIMPRSCEGCFAFVEPKFVESHEPDSSDTL